MPKKAKQWCAIPEFSFYKFDPKDMQLDLRNYRDFAAKCIKAKKSMLFLLAP